MHIVERGAGGRPEHLHHRKRLGQRDDVAVGVESRKADILRACGDAEVEELARVRDLERTKHGVGGNPFFRVYSAALSPEPGAD